MTMAFNEKTFVPDNNTNWIQISQKECLSESFMEKYKNRLYWVGMSVNQKMSRSFIIKHLRRVYIFGLYENRFLPEKLKIELRKWGKIPSRDFYYFHEFREKIEDRLL